jgi:membrane glycosyltransferase
VAGLVSAVPLAVLTAQPRLGRWLAAAGLCRIPEEARLQRQPESGAAGAPWAVGLPPHRSAP